MQLNKSNFITKNISNFKKSEEKDEKDKIQNDSESIFGILKSNSSSDISYLSERDISEINSVFDKQSDKTIKIFKPNLDKTISECSSCASTLSRIKDYQEKLGRNFFDDVMQVYGNDGLKIFDDIIKKLDDSEVLTKKIPIAFYVGGLIADCINHHSISSRYFAEKFVDNCSEESLTASLKRRSLDKLANYYMPNSSLAEKLTEKYLDVRGKLNDGKIEYSFQGHIGDCWLLTGINAMSYSSVGQELLNNAVGETENGYSVRLAGLDKDVEVTKKELVEAIQSETYSTGDPDMLLFELAFEKGLGEVENKTASAGEESDGQSDEHAAIDGGSMLLFISALTGKKTKTVTNSKGYNDEAYFSQNPVLKFFRKFINKLIEPLEYAIDLNPALDKIENSDDVIASVSFMSKDNNEERYITDTEGKKHSVTGSNSDSRHICAIKSVDGDLVTIVNPWDSEEDIVITREELLKNAFAISYCDLSDV